MSKEAQSHELTYDLIKQVVHGDQEAIEAYLLHYDAYINSLVMYDEVGPDGQLHSYIDEDITQRNAPTPMLAILYLMKAARWFIPESSRALEVQPVPSWYR